MIQYLINTSLAIGAGTVLFAQGIQFSQDSWNDILHQAKSENKVIFLDAYTTWCGPCKAMSSKIFPQAEVGDFFNKNFVNAKFDMEKGEGITLAEKYNVRAYPTLLFIDGDGEVIHTVLGSMSASELIESGQTALNPLKNAKGLKEQYLDNPDDREIALKYIQHLIDTDAPELETVGISYLRKQENWYVMEHEDLIASLVQIEDPEIRHAILKDWDTYKVNRQHFSLEFQSDFPHTIGSMEIFFNIDRFKDKKVFDELVLPLTNGEKDHAYAGLYAFYLAETNQTKLLMKHYKKMLKKFNSSDDLISISNGIAENGLSQKDYKLGLKTVDKALTRDPEHQYARYTKAVLLQKMGNEKEAEVIITKLRQELNQ